MSKTTVRTFETAGKRLRIARKALGFGSVESFVNDGNYWRRDNGELIQKNSKRVREWETGGVPEHEIKAVARALGVAAYYLIGTEENFDDESFRKYYLQILDERAGATFAGLSPYEKLLQEENNRPDRLLSKVKKEGYDKKFLRQYVSDSTKKLSFRERTAKILFKFDFNSWDVELLAGCSKSVVRTLLDYLDDIFNQKKYEEIKRLLSDDAVIAVMKAASPQKEKIRFLPIVEWMVNEEECLDVQIFRHADGFEFIKGKLQIIRAIVDNSPENRLELIALQKRDDSHLVRNEIGFLYC